jgi:hypothetical protein
MTRTLKGAGKLTVLRIAIFTVLSIVLSLPMYADQSTQQRFTQSRDLTTTERSAKSVSLVSLISVPEKYAGKVIVVEGFLHKQYEDERLYLSKEDATHLITENALNVSFAKSNLLLQTVPNQNLPSDVDHALHTFDQKYVLLIGKFSPGNLTEITRVLELKYD